MPACVVIQSNTVRPADVPDCAAAGPGHYLLLTTDEVGTLYASPLNLSIEDGLLVAGSVCGVWLIAWGFRALARALNSDGEALE